MALDPQAHVMDAPEIHVFDNFHIPLPDFNIGEYHFQVTKFMVLELLAAVLIIAIYVPLARRARGGALPRGAWWNSFESLLTFVRNEIAKPNLDPPPGYHEHGHDHHGHDEHKQDAHAPHGAAHDIAAEEPPPPPAFSGYSPADKFVPYLWTVFLFILFLNLLGMFPFMGSPTASIYVTGALALVSFVMMHVPALIKMGPIHYIKSWWPGIQIEVPVVGWLMGILISALLFTIELFGTVIKSGVLAIRLFANMFAGHMVLATILLFIVTVGNAVGLNALWGTVTVASVLGVVALSLLEIFVAFLQAYVFTFLTALFMGMTQYPQH